MPFRLLLSALLLTAATLVKAQGPLPFETQAVTAFDEPWALAFLPDGRLLVTEKKGRLLVVTQDGSKTPVSGIPDVDYGGQGGLGDVALHPAFPDNGIIYLSYVEAGVGDTRGAAVARGRLDLGGRRPALTGLEVIWRQYPKYVGYGHYGHRLLFDDEGHLWITSGDRQKFTPSQDMQSNSGKVLRLNDDGTVPEDNPYVNYFTEIDPLVDDIGVYDQFWSIGHRNPLGIDTDLEGRLWVIEMGPKGGDELNLIQRGGNYGYPVVSNGDHYDDRPMPDHDTRPEFLAPMAWWTPVISPGDLHVVRGDTFSAWRGDALAAGLSSRAIVRIALDGESARELERYDMGARIRAITEGPEGALWVLEDERGDSRGRLLKLTPGD